MASSLAYTSIHLAQHAPGFAAARLVDVTVALPEFEEQFDLPAGARQYQGLAHGEHVRGHIGDQESPVTPGQAGGAGRAATVPGGGAQAASPLVGDLLRPAA